ncbi:MAG: beta-mannosidase [Bacteroidales bacterium]|nr:beta-mannosidase [Bacteroidales bacterium]
MRLKNLTLTILAAFALFSCACGGTAGKVTEPSEEPSSQQPATISEDPSTPQLTLAQKLYKNMDELRSSGIMFGAQIPTEYGLSGGSRWEDDGSILNSDTKYLTGSHPAVCGWDISEIELDHPRNIDGEDFGAIRKHIEAAYARGAVNTISWHCANPATMGNSWDNTPAIKPILPGGAKHDMFIGWLDRVADFLGSIKTPDGQRVPLIFRPWHEHTGNGFWWGKGSSTASEFKALWKMTVDYLRETRGMDNLLFAYSPDAIHFIWSPRSDYRDIYLEFWPGDEYVDILGLDAYDSDGRRFSEEVPYLCPLVAQMAAEKGKFAALTECGIENNNPAHSSYTNKEWWTKALYPAIKGSGMSFALVWRNGGLPPQSHYFNAYKGCYSEADFVKFASLEDILLEKDLPALYD